MLRRGRGERRRPSVVVQVQSQSDHIWRLFSFVIDQLTSHSTRKHPVVQRGLCGQGVSEAVSWRCESRRKGTHTTMMMMTMRFRLCSDVEHAMMMWFHLCSNLDIVNCVWSQTVLCSGHGKVQVLANSFILRFCDCSNCRCVLCSASRRRRRMT